MYARLGLTQRDIFIYFSQWHRISFFPGDKYITYMRLGNWNSPFEQFGSLTKEFLSKKRNNSLDIFVARLNDFYNNIINT